MKPYFNYSNFIIWWQLMLVTDIFILQYLGCSAGLSTFHQASLSKPPDPWWCAPAPLWCAITLLHNNLHLVCTRPSLMCTNLHGGVHQTFFGVHFVGAHALFTSQTSPMCVNSLLSCWWWWWWESRLVKLRRAPWCVRTVFSLVDGSFIAEATPRTLGTPENAPCIRST